MKESRASRLLARKSGILIIGAALALFAAFSCSSGPIVLWQTNTAASGIFSRDGSAVLLSTSTGFELRRSSDGALQSRLTLPQSSRAYDTKAFSPDGQLVALSIFASGTVRIELWRVADGALVRTITTDATTNVRSLDFSTTGLLASMQRFAYQQGGLLRVFRVSDGALVHSEGPLLRNGATRVKFSPDARYLAVQDNVTASGIRVLRTADWSTALTLGNFVGFFDWAPDSASLWIAGSALDSPAYQLVQVPSGAVLKTVPWTASGFYPTAVTPDGRFFLASQAVTTDPSSPPGDTIEFVSASDSSAAVVYQSSPPIVSSGNINSAGTQFTYSICPPDGTCTFYMAQMPSL